MRKLRRLLGWVVVVPAAFGGTLVSFALSCLIVTAGLKLAGPVIFVEWLPQWLLLVPWIGPPIGFVVAGGLAAPAHKTIVGMVLLFLWAFLAGDIAAAVMVLARLAAYGR